MITTMKLHIPKEERPCASNTHVHDLEESQARWAGQVLKWARTENEYNVKEPSNQTSANDLNQVGELYGDDGG